MPLRSGRRRKGSGLLDVDHLITEVNCLMLGLTAAVFLVLNKRNNAVVVIGIKKKHGIVPDSGKTTVQNMQSFPKLESPSDNVFQSTNCAFTTVNKPRESPKDVDRQNLTDELKSTPSKPVQLSVHQKSYGDDLGISGLHLGRRKRKPAKNHLMTEPRPYYNRSNDGIWNRPSILSPSRLNVDDRVYSTPPNGFLEHSANQTRCSSQTSGVSSLSSTPQLHDALINDRDFDCFSDTPMNSPNRVMSFYPQYDPMYQQPLAMSPHSYYQFAAMFHRMYTPSMSSSFGSDNSANRTLVNNVHQCEHEKFYIFLISLIIICNFVLIGLISYKEFFTSKV